MDLLTLPPTARDDLRARLGLEADTPPRLSFVAGFGDVVGTYRDWQQGRHDPRVPVMTYSAMLYEMIDRLGAQGQVVTRFAPPETAAPNMRFDQVERSAWSGRLGYFRSEARYAREITDAVAAFDPHIVIAHSDAPSACWPALGRGRHLILSLHNTYWPMNQQPTGWRARLKQGWLRRNARALDGAICTSAECLRQIRTLTRANLPGRAEYPQIVTRYTPETRSRARRLLYLGRLEAHKGIFMLHDAFSTLKAQHPDLELVFAGKGRAEEELRARIAAGPEGAEYVGMLDSAGVHEAITQADLLVCPTTSGFNEGLALVGLEAAAHGIPSVLSSIVPAVDLLQKACAVFEVDDTTDLTRCLDRLIRDDAAYQALQQATGAVADGLYDRAGGWGSQLGEMLLAL